MQGPSTNFAAAGLIACALATAVVLLAVFGYRAWRRTRITAEERERRRCAQLVAAGKIHDATLVEVREHLVFYSYLVRGVEYTASQDLSRFADKVALDFSGVSVLGVRYDPRNPANSIVMAEEWSGLRGVPRLSPENHASH